MIPVDYLDAVVTALRELGRDTNADELTTGEIDVIAESYRAVLPARFAARRVAAHVSAIRDVHGASLARARASQIVRGDDGEDGA